MFDFFFFILKIENLEREDELKNCYVHVNFEKKKSSSEYYNIKDLYSFLKIMIRSENRKEFHSPIKVLNYNKR